MQLVTIAPLLSARTKPWLSPLDSFTNTQHTRQPRNTFCATDAVDDPALPAKPSVTLDSRTTQSSNRFPLNAFATKPLVAFAPTTAQDRNSLRALAFATKPSDAMPPRTAQFVNTPSVVSCAKPAVPAITFVTRQPANVV